jgi:hypothetical protein
VVTLKGLERQLLFWLDAHLPELGDFGREHGLGGGRAVNTVGLDRDDDAAANLEEETGYDMLALRCCYCEFERTYRSVQQYGPGQAAQRRRKCNRPCQPTCGTSRDL